MATHGFNARRILCAGAFALAVMPASAMRAPALSPPPEPAMDPTPVCAPQGGDLSGYTVTMQTLGKVADVGIRCADPELVGKTDRIPTSAWGEAVVQATALSPRDWAVMPMQTFFVPGESLESPVVTFRVLSPFFGTSGDSGCQVLPFLAAPGLPGDVTAPALTGVFTICPLEQTSAPPPRVTPTPP